jgi:hypothetical protein
MTITSQALAGIARRTFKQVLRNHKRLSKAKQKKLSDALARITRDAINSSGVTVKGQINSKMADLIKARILNNREFNPQA